MKHKFVFAILALAVVGAVTYVKRVGMAFNAIFGTVKLDQASRVMRDHGKH